MLVQISTSTSVVDLLHLFTECISDIGTWMIQNK